MGRVGGCRGDDPDRGGVHQYPAGKEEKRKRGEEVEEERRGTKEEGRKRGEEEERKRGEEEERKMIRFNLTR